MSDRDRLVRDLSPEERARLFELVRRRRGGAPPEGGSAPAGGPTRLDGDRGPLSFAQERLWFLDRVDPGNPVYNIPEALRLSGDLSLPALDRTLTALVERHEVLRTRLAVEDTGDGGEPVQEIRPVPAGGLPVVDLSGLRPGPGLDAEVARLSRREARRPFDLASGPMFRASLLRLDPQSHVLLLTVHHGASDGWSRGLLLRDTAALYGAFAAGRDGEAENAAGRIRYLDWAAWQRERLADGALDHEIAWWREALDRVPRVLDLPTDRPRPPVQAFRGRRVDLDLSGAPFDGGGVEALARRLGTTPFTILLAAFGVFLARWSGRRRFVVGTPVAGRDRPETRGLVGLFVNTLPLPIDLSPERSPQAEPVEIQHAEPVETQQAEPVEIQHAEPVSVQPAESFEALVGRMHTRAVGAFEHQELPFERLVEELAPERMADRSPLVQVLFALQNAPAPPLELPGLDLEVVDTDPGVSRFDLTLSVAPRDDGGYTASFEHDRDLFDRTTIERLGRAYRRLLAAAVTAPGTPWTALPVDGPAARHAVLHEWNDTGSSKSSGAPDRSGDREPVHRQVAARAEEDPSAPAVVWEGGSWSYAELVGRARRLALRLRRLGVGPETVVALLTGPGPDLVLGALAVLEAGGAYLPLDPTHPPDRLGFQLADAGAQVLLVSPGDGGRDPAAGPELDGIGFDGTVLEVPTAEDAPPGGPDAAPPAGPPPVADRGGRRLAYVIYTSGSTGRPKGVAVEHRNLAHLAAWYRKRYGIRRGDRGSQVAGVAFDASVWEIWGHLAAGATLHLAGTEERMAPPALLPWLARHAVTRSFVPTPAAELLLREPWPEEIELRTLLTGGDRLHGPPPADLPAPLVNHYGPTETTVVATAGEVPPAEGPASGERPPDIGRPVDRMRAYLLDPELRPVPLGALGEIHLAGEGVARGYLGRPAETAAGFVPDPFSRSEPGARLYRTGDLARHLPDGRIAFHGRRDHQVEVRGLRLEPGEVEAALAGHPEVADAVVVPVTTADAVTGLAAYVTAAGDDQPTADDLSRHLRRLLPDWMIPTSFTVVPEIPLTANGKVDRRALPEPHRAGTATPVEPRDEAERLVAAAWREVLGVEAVAPDDNFFDLGGHSLLLVRLRDRLAAAFGRAVDVVDLFRFPTVATQAERLGGAGRAVPAPAAPARRRGPRDEPIAVVGVSCRMPGARDVEAFWQMLRDGREAGVELDDETLAAAGVDAATRAKPEYVRRVPLLDEADRFDAGFFGVPPREAEAMDPQHRVFLECAWEALEDAGHDPARYPGAIGVWAGASLNDYLLHLYANRAAADALGGLQAKVGIDKDFLATRTAYKLGLTGPAVTVQTACSTSLVALHLACRALGDGECDMALAGAVAIRNLRREGYLHEPGGVLSPDGRCRAFDAAAGGTVGGDGAGLVVLKRLSDARADGDRVLALVRGSAVNNDGSLKVGYTAPSPEGQTAVIRAALDDAGVDPATVGYIEAHGTGTALGDPVEVAALARALGGGPAPEIGRRLMGSVKTNVGHLDTAAGIAGLVKAVLALDRGEIPPSLHFREPNPRLDLEAAGLSVVTRPTRWTRRPQDPPRRAGVSSFGIGGTNAHVILEEAPAPEPHPESEPGLPERPWHLLCLSAHGPAALEETTARIGDRLSGDAGGADGAPSLADVAYTLSVGRRHFPRRRAVVASTREEAARALAGATGATLTASDPVPAVDVPVGFLFPGQGHPAPGATRALLDEEPIFRESLDRCLDLLAPHLAGLPGLGALLHPEAEDEAEAAGRLRSTALAQPATFAVSYAMARLWESWGVRPAAMLGHSLGEYVAACLAGVVSLPDALALVAARGRWMDELPEGAMLGVPLPAAEIEPRLSDGTEIAAFNAPDRTVVSGTCDAVHRLAEELASDGVATRPLETSRAFHSPLVEPLVEPWRRRMAEVELRPPRTPYVSSLTGTWITPEEATDPAYWARHLREPVRFSAGVAALSGRAPVLLEVGPGRTLSALARRCDTPDGGSGPAGVPVRTLASLAGTPLRPARALARLWLAGVEVDWKGFWTGRRRSRVALPTYPFERKRYWLEPDPGSDPRSPSRPGEGRDPVREPLDRWLHLPAWRPTLPAAAAGRPETDPDGGWLVVVPEDGGGPFAEEVVAGLAEPDHPVVTVELARSGDGDTPRRLGTDRWRLSAASREAWRTLLSELADGDRLPRRMVHLANVGDTTSPGLHGRLDGLDPAIDAAFHGPLALVRALAETAPGETTRLWLVADGLADVTGGEPVAPEKALLLGPAQVAPRELPHLHCRVVDLQAGLAREDGAAAARRLLAELGVEEAPPYVALRNGRRFVRGFEPVAAPPADRTRLRPGAVTLITGGLGGVGLELASELARSAEAPRLVLLGRSPFPERSAWSELADGSGPRAPLARRLLALEENGARVEVVSADIADPAAADRVVASLVERHGALHGIVHAAGVPGGGVLLRKERAEAEAVLRPKVQGTAALHRALVRHGVVPDFFVLCSSLNSVLGVFGQVDYVAANAFQDAFAEAAASALSARPHRTDQIDRTDRVGSAARVVPPLSVAWDRWRDTGMAAAGRTPTGHPLLGERVRGGLREHAFRARLSARDVWVLDEHRIAGTPVLPGTAYLEMARAAFGAAVGGEDPVPVEISETVFLAPLRVPDGEEREVVTVLRRPASDAGDEPLFDFEIASRAPAAPGLWRRHATGRVTVAEISATGDEPSWAREEVGVRALTEPDAEHAPAASGTDEPVARYGGRWQSLRGVGTADSDAGFVAAARLELPQEHAGDVETFGLHPALLDVATGFGTGLDRDLDRGNGPGPGAAASAQLPFAYRRVVIHRPLPARLESRSLRLDDDAGRPDDPSHDGAGTGGGTVSFRLRLTDPEGRLLVAVERYTLRRFAPAAGDGPAPPLPDLAAAEGPGASAPELDRLVAGAASGEDAEGMSPAEGAETFHRALATGPPPRLLVSTSNLDARAERMRSLTPEAVLAAAAELGGPAPAERHGRPDLATAYVAPRDDAEAALAEIWQELLGIDRVGVEDDFFELGGDSVLGLRIVARAREAGLELDPGELFERPTVAELARGARRTDPAPTPERGPELDPEQAATTAPASDAGPEPGDEPSPDDFPDADLSGDDLDLLVNRMRSMD